jgi:hypothetical protein
MSKSETINHISDSTLSRLFFFVLSKEKSFKYSKLILLLKCQDIW